MVDEAARIGVGFFSDLTEYTGVGTEPDETAECGLEVDLIVESDVGGDKDVDESDDIDDFTVEVVGSIVDVVMDGTMEVAWVKFPMGVAGTTVVMADAVETGTGLVDVADVVTLPGVDPTLGVGAMGV